MRDLYQILGVNKDASTNAIKRAFRNKAISEHPDKGGNAERMAWLTEAYHTLSDPTERRKFDHEWEIFNESYDTEISSVILDYLPTAGVAFSKSFRQQHAHFVRQCLRKSLDQNQASSYLKGYSTKLYFCTDNVVTDLFSFIKVAKRNSEAKLDKGHLTPEIAVKHFNAFLRGDYSKKNLKELSKAFEEKIKQLEASRQQAGYEFQLYCGIREILIVAAEDKAPTSRILFSLQKITEYAKHNPDQSISFMAPLLQSKYFRGLYLQALHYYWLSEESVLDESFVKAFNGQVAIESLIERFKSQLSEKRSDKPAKLLRYVRLLLGLEKDLNKRADITVTDRALFYRQKAFHLLDWIPAITRFAEHSITINVLLRIGIMLQKAAAQELDRILRMADEKLAAKIYILAAGIGHHATPDVELYACLHSVKCLLSIRYTDSEFKGVLEALQDRAIWLADLFPIFQAPQSNADFILQEDKPLDLMRQLLHALIGERGAIDHNYVRVFYQAYEACLKNWYQKHQDAALERKFRQRLMYELLESRRWTRADVNYNLNVPWPLTDLDVEGWSCLKSSILTSAKKANVPTYNTIYGVEFNCKTGEIDLILDDCADNRKDCDRLFTSFDLHELLRHGLASAIFSLDPVDNDMPYHPFNKMRFAPSGLYRSKLLHTMFLTDYLLKFLTVGCEVQRREPFKMRPLDKIICELPDHLKKVIYDFHSSNNEESMNRFWIESEEVELAVDDERLTESGDVLFAFGKMQMVVKHHKLKRDVEGKLVDAEGEDEGWDCYVLTREQKRELDNGERVIANSALIIIKELWVLVFWENGKTTQRITLVEDRSDLVRLCERERDDQEKVKTDDSESLRQIYKIVLKAAEKSGVPHRYSPEFIFAQEFTKNYDEFAVYFPEFGRLRELSKAPALVRVMAAHREANQEEVRLIRKRLQDKSHWQAEEHEYWQKTRQKLGELIRDAITKQIEEWRSKLSKEKLRQRKRESLNDIRRQIGPLQFTRSAPEIIDICDSCYNEIKSDIIAKHGYSVWNSVSNDVYKEAIEPKIPNWIAQLEAQKREACHRQLMELFKDELAELSEIEASQSVHTFLSGNDEPLLEHLVYNQRTIVAKQIKEIYPEHTIKSLDEALNNSLSAINGIVVCETNKASERHKQMLKVFLTGREKLEQSFADFGFGADEEEIDLEGTCLWVPASFRHDVEKGYTRTVYGGVHIMGRIRQYINPKDRESVLRQTRPDARRLRLNTMVGNAVNNFVTEELIKPLYPGPEYEVKQEYGVKTPHGRRRLDCAILKNGKLVAAWENKVNTSSYLPKQEKADRWIHGAHSGMQSPVKLFRLHLRRSPTF